ncbi:MAG: hypothetical protein U0670_08355 [Anaerolineae bacterium]
MTMGACSTQLGPYKIYRADEMPDLDVILVQTLEPTGPFGAKAVAEIPKDGVAPALRNAIYDATGVQINRIPSRRNGYTTRCVPQESSRLRGRI